MSLSFVTEDLVSLRDVLEDLLGARLLVLVRMVLERQPPVGALDLVLGGPGLEPQLPLAGDYQGLGGPASVPLYTPAAFEAPARPVERTILDEIFLEPSNRQLDAYYRVLTKGKV